MQKGFQRFCLVLLGLVLSSVSAWAQQTGTVSGVVRDPQGAVLPGVRVSVTAL